MRLRRKKPGEVFAAELSSRILDTVEALIVVLDTEGRIMTFNHKCEELTGYRATHVKGRLVWDFLVPKSHGEEAKGYFAELVSGHFAAEHITPWIAKDGSERTIRWHSATIPGPDGKVAWVIATGTDVTEELAEKDELTRVLLLADYNPMPVLQLDARGVVKNSNTAALQVFNKRRLSGENWRDLCPGLAEGAFERFLRSPKAETLSVEARIGTKTFVFDLFLVPDRRLVQVYGRDLTEVREVQERFREAEVVFKSFTEGALDAMLFLDQKGNILDCNPATERLFGYRRNELVGKNLSRLRLFSPRQTANLIRPPGGRNAVNEQFEVTRKDGRRMSVAVNRALLRRGAKPEVLVVAHDITERRRQAEELARLREQLAALEAEVASTHKQLVGSRPGGPDLAAQVVARLEQQLKIPFGVIRNSAYMLELTLRSGNGPALGYVRELVSALDQASLALGEIPQRAAPQVARRSRVKVCELVRPCLQALPERVTVGYAIPEELPPVEVDVAQIQRVIQALVSNAVEAMPKGGQLELRAESQDGAVILEVRDTGSGMTREVQERVFQPFFSTKGRLGLGLFRIREVVEANQGRVEFVSDEGKGTTFRLWLPKAGVAEKTSGQGEMEKQEPP